MIPISSVKLPESSISHAIATLQSGQLAQGELVSALEGHIAETVGAKHAIAVSSGTAALSAAIRSLLLPPGSEVVTTPFTFVATVNACLLAGLSVRFADISLDDFNLDPDSAEQAIGPQTRVLLPVHLYGQMADMQNLSEIARRRDLQLVEDAAQSFQAHIAGQAAGTWGMGCFSLYATKNITSGEGGFITTSDGNRAAWLQAYRNQGMVTRYNYEMIGENLRMTDFAAALVFSQIAAYESNIAIRERNARTLIEGLADIGWLRLPKVMTRRRHVWHQFTVLLAEEAPITRDAFASLLAERGIGSGIYYPRLLGSYLHISSHPRVHVGFTPRAFQASQSCLSLPVHSGVSENETEQIIDAIRDIARKV